MMKNNKLTLALLLIGIACLGLGFYSYFNKPEPKQVIAQAQANSQFTVPMNIPWTDTGIQLGAGQVLTITASGKGVWKNIHSDNPNASPTAYEECGPDGTPPVDKQDYYSNINNYQCPIAYKGALIGRIGENSIPFAVGLNFKQTINQSGKLYLGINDQKPELGNNWDDNSGSFTANLTIKSVIDLPTNPDGSITFPGNYSGWHSIGVGSFTLEVKGMIDYVGETANANESSRMGDVTALVNELPFGVLLAKVGEQGKPFKVGYSHKFETDAQMVYIAINDSYYPDNTGAFTIYIRK
jgi:hypothetical protein